MDIRDGLVGVDKRSPSRTRTQTVGALLELNTSIVQIFQGIRTLNVRVAPLKDIPYHRAENI